MMIEIDGSEGEGGGQMLRSALALSALTGNAFTMGNIRAKRSNPGLAAQHLTAVRGVAGLCAAEVEGAQPGSMRLIFQPGPLEGGKHRLDVGTAGSISLVLQACLLASLRAERETVLEVTGGTNVRWSPPIDYYELVLLPLLRRLGVVADLEVQQRGFYPEGGGKVRMTIAPSRALRPLRLIERGGFEGVEGIVFTQNLPEHVGQRMANAVRKDLIDESPRLRMDRASGPSAGAGVALRAVFADTMLGADGLGERGLPAERVAAAAVQGLKAEMRSAATVDVHAADQILPYLAIASGQSRFIAREMTGHMSTQIELIRRFVEVDIKHASLPGGVAVDVLPSHT
jgi:RNA 3'-phosphate cyclase